MSTLINYIRLLKPIKTIRPPTHFQPSKYHQYWRGLSDKPKSGTASKLVAHGAENENPLRIRRARPADVPRVLRFVRQNSHIVWPCFDTPKPNFHLILGDYVTRALAQGHSMLAEQQEPKRGWSEIRGLAISLTVCPWDAMMLDKCAKCIRCKRSRQLLHFTAHCLRAPALHEKYQINRILQVILIVPPNVPKSAEIVHMLAKNTIKRGQEVGLPVIRFDVTNNPVARALDELDLVKEWELSYNILPDAMKETDDNINVNKTETLSNESDKSEDETEIKPLRNEHFIAVYSSTHFHNRP